MKRYEITKELKFCIKNSEYSLNKLEKLTGFRVKNIFYKNISISENNLKKLSLFLKIPALEEINFNYTKNLGKYAFTEPINPIKKDNKLSELIGIMLGDGNIYRNCIKVAFDKRNKKYIQYVKDLFEEIVGIKIKQSVYMETNNAYLYYYNKNFTKELLKLGLKRGNKKKNQLGIPKWIKENNNYSKACLRGLIDTDGCIYRCKRERRVYIKFTNLNKKLMEDFKEVTKKLGYDFSKAGYKDTTLYKKDQVAKFIRVIKPLKSQGTVV